MKTILLINTKSMHFWRHGLKIIWVEFGDYWTDGLGQGSSNLDQFSSNPNQTQLSMLIRVLKIIRKSQVGEFDQGWS